MSAIIEESVVVNRAGARAAPADTVRVLHVINGEHYSGAERVQDLLALRLGEFGYEVGFACLKPGRFDAMRQARQAPLYDARMKSRIDLSSIFRLAKVIERDQYALVHTHTPRAAMIGRLAALAAGVPLVHHMHSPTTVDSTRRWRNRANAWIERASLTGLASVIAVSESLGRYARTQGIPADRVHVVPNGVPVIGPLTCPSPPSGEWILGTVALMRPRKGLEVLLEALAVLRRQGHPVRLRAVGPFETPEYEKHVKQQVARLRLEGLIDWVGFTRDVPAELDRMDLFVLPSLFGEGLPMVILEAMAAGVPVVGTKVEGVPEVIRDRVDGLVVPPNDPHALAEGIAEVMRGAVEWSGLRNCAHARQAARYSDRSMAAGVAAVYDNILHK